MSLIEELKRRKVFRVAASYAVVAFIIFQLVEILFPIFNFPQWTQQFVVIIILLGFPIALIFSWVFDKTPVGFIKTDAVKSKVNKNTENSTASKPFYLDSKNLYLLLGLVIAFLLGSYGSGSFQSSVDDKSIAVLPFDNYSTAPEDQFFSDGITEVIIANLAKVKDLKVISRTSVMEYKNTTKKIKDIAKELGVAHILEGSIQRASGRVRVVGQLIDTKTDEHIWAETYDKDETDIFELQSEVAIEIAQAMKSELTSDEKARINEKSTESNIAYEYFLRGNILESSSRTEEKLNEAVNQYERAIAIDPNFAEAHAQLGNIHVTIYFYKHDFTKERLELSKKYIDKAIELKPDNATVRIARGTYYYRGFRDYGKALADFSFAKKLEPGNSSATYSIGLIYRRLGDYDEAIKNILEASNLNPKSSLIISQLSQTFRSVKNYEKSIYYIEKYSKMPEATKSRVQNTMITLPFYKTGKINKALSEINKIEKGLDRTKLYFARISKNPKKIIEIINSSNSEVYENIEQLFHKNYFLGISDEINGDKSNSIKNYNIAVNYLKNRIIQSPNDPRLYSSLGLVYARMGEKKKAISEGSKAIELIPISQDAISGASQERALATIYSIIGEKNLALDRIEYLSSLPNGFHYGQLLLDPDFDLLRKTKRFNLVIENLKQL